MLERAGKASRARRQTWWLLVAVLLAIAGIAGSVLAAGAVSGADRQRSRQEFEQSTAEITSTLQLAIQHEDDLTLSGAAYLAGNPNGSNAQFIRWSNSIQAMARYPELHDYGNAVIVAAPNLAAFAARAQADPWAPLGPGGKFQVEPAGIRPYYCFGTVGQVRNAQVGAPAGQDFCATGLGPALMAARDAGTRSYAPFTVGTVSELGVSTPYYRGGGIPPTEQGRRANFLGWFGTTIVPNLLLDRALQGHPQTQVTFRYQANSLEASFSSGAAPAGAESITTALNNGWTVQTSGAVASAAILHDTNALRLLVAGVLLSILLGALVFVLGTGRARARRLVAERSAQLQGAQALLVDTARQAGMAEIATNVLHNVGNVLNSVNVSANLVCQKIRSSKASGLDKAVAMLNEHPHDLGEFLTDDPRGRALPGYLDALASTLSDERVEVDAEVQRLSKGVAHIKEIVAAQQSLAGVSGVVESVRISDLVEDALRMAGIDEDDVRVTREFGEDSPVSLDRHRVMLVLVNLISNASYAMKGDVGRPRELGIRAELVDGQGMRITVVDSGVGIPPENLTRIFVHGFTTHLDGHGFGLHSSALAATEMGGALTVHDNTDTPGTAFTLQVPVNRELVPV